MAHRPSRRVRATKKDLEKAFSKWMSRHHRTRAGEEAYDFNIKIQKIWIPPIVRTIRSEKDIDETVDNEMTERLSHFASSMTQMYPWITDWLQTGRSGGWLTFVTDGPVLTDNEEIPLEPHHDQGPREWMPNAAIPLAHKRLSDLQDIEQQLRKGIATLKKDLESPVWWDVSPKEWSPQKKSTMGGLWDFLRPKKEERREDIPVAPLEYHPGSSMVPAPAPGTFANPFEILAPPAPSGGGMIPAPPPGVMPLFDVLGPETLRPSRLPAAYAPIKQPTATPDVRWSMFEPAPTPARTPRGPGRRINWKLPSPEELIARFDPALLGEIFSRLRALRHTKEFRDLKRKVARDGEPMRVVVNRITDPFSDLVFDLANFFGVPEEVIDTYDWRGEVREAIWDELFFPLFDTLTQAMEIARPDDIPGWFAIEFDPGSDMYDLKYFET